MRTCKWMCLSVVRSASGRRYARSTRYRSERARWDRIRFPGRRRLPYSCQSKRSNHKSRLNSFPCVPPTVRPTPSFAEQTNLIRVRILQENRPRTPLTPHQPPLYRVSTSSNPLDLYSTNARRCNEAKLNNCRQEMTTRLSSTTNNGHRLRNPLTESFSYNPQIGRAHV